MYVYVLEYRTVSGAIMMMEARGRIFQQVHPFDDRTCLYG